MHSEGLFNEGLSNFHLLLSVYSTQLFFYKIQAVNIFIYSDLKYNFFYLFCNLCK